MPDLERLSRTVKERWDERQADRRAKSDERLAIIKSALSEVPNMDFWCKDCQRDFTSRGYKRVITYAAPIAFYEGKCPKRHWCRRRITDKATDPYYRQSQQVKTLKAKYRKDFLQPGEVGFKTYYGDPDQKFYRELEAQERAKWQAKPSILV